MPFYHSSNGGGIIKCNHLPVNHTSVTLEWFRHLLYTRFTELHVTKCFCHFYDIHGKTASHITCAFFLFFFTIRNLQRIAIQLFPGDIRPFHMQKVWYFPGNN